MSQLYKVALRDFSRRSVLVRRLKVIFGLCMTKGKTFLFCFCVCELSKATRHFKMLGRDGKVLRQSTKPSFPPSRHLVRSREVEPPDGGGGGGKFQSRGKEGTLCAGRYIHFTSLHFTSLHCAGEHG
jgi:hypothetical protein